MKKILYLLAFAPLALAAQTPAPAEAPAALAPPKDTTYWRKKIKFGANLTQANFSGNWKAGGVNNLSFATLMQGFAEYKRDRNSFRSEIDFQYGAVKNQGQDFRKSLDRIFIDTKYGRNLSKSWSLYSSLNFLSQFARGFNYGKNDSTGEVTATRISQFFAPAYLTESVGFEYKPVDYFFARFGTGTLRQTFVTDTTLYRNTEGQKNYGVPIHKVVRNEFALQVMASFEKDIAKNINLKARYIGFFNYITIGQPKTWDHRLEATLLAKVNKYVSATVSSIMIYDLDSDPKPQLSYQLGLGVLAVFGNAKE